MIIEIFKKSTVYTLAIAFAFTSLVPLLEPQNVLAQSTVSDTVQVTLTVDTGISITSPADVTMAPNIGITSNGSIGGTTWNVKTNDPDGYILSVRASTTPALRNGVISSFIDYTPTTPGTPETWNTPTNSIEFGYSAFGTNVSTASWGTG